MRMQFNSYHNCFEFFCAECHRGIADEFEYKYCPYCRHEYDPTKVNEIRNKIAKIVFEGMSNNG